MSLAMTKSQRSFPIGIGRARYLAYERRRAFMQFWAIMIGGRMLRRRRAEEARSPRVSRSKTLELRCSKTIARRFRRMANVLDCGPRRSTGDSRTGSRGRRTRAWDRRSLGDCSVGQRRGAHYTAGARTGHFSEGSRTNCVDPLGAYARRTGPPSASATFRTISAEPEVHLWSLSRKGEAFDRVWGFGLLLVASALGSSSGDPIG
jgi:hypothetical protein